MPLRIALAGLGSAALRAHIPALQRLGDEGAVQVVGLCDRSPQQRTVASRTIPGVACFEDTTAMLDAVGCDLLTVATPPSVHLDAVRAATARGIDVLCEKPLGLCAADVVELESIASGPAAPLLATVHQYRHAEGWEAAQTLLARAIRHDQEFDLRIEVERPGTDPLSAGGWRSDPSGEGGILGDHAVHYLSLCHGLGASVRLLDCSRTGAPGRETAAIRLAIGPGQATIVVTYEGRRRRNLLEVEIPAERTLLRWCDGAISLSSPGGDGGRQSIGSLSDRRYVNALYEPFYRDLAAGFNSRARRAMLSDDTLMVAGLLQQCVERVAAPVLARADAAEDSIVPDFLRDAFNFVDEELSSLARAVLLAFADLGVYLPSNRERLIDKIRSLDPLEPTQLGEFLDLC
ncbi:MAG: Gfo/Idh/MocA family protein, partial [Candidatus Dormibacteria bacterium]